MFEFQNFRWWLNSNYVDRQYVASKRLAKDFFRKRKLAKWDEEDQRKLAEELGLNFDKENLTDKN